MNKEWKSSKRNNRVQSCKRTLAKSKRFRLLGHTKHDCYFERFPSFCLFPGVVFGKWIYFLGRAIPSHRKYAGNVPSSSENWGGIMEVFVSSCLVSWPSAFGDWRSWKEPSLSYYCRMTKNAQLWHMFSLTGYLNSICFCVESYWDAAESNEELLLRFEHFICIFGRTTFQTT
jgi:hypothetical protein